MENPRKTWQGFFKGVVYLGVLLLIVVSSACSPHRDLYPKIDRLAVAGKYADAAQLVKANKNKYGERNEVLYNLDLGVMSHYAGEYEASNKAFEEAERIMDDLFTKSISGEVGAFLSNDNTLPYRGEDFESVVVNLYRALNYAKLKDVDAALVEARKVNEKLTYINSKYPAGKKNVYREDGFARLLAGVLYEMGGTRDDLNDAFISNRLAAQTYDKEFAKLYHTPAPDMLASNLVTTAIFMGGQELSEAKKKYPAIKPLSPQEKRAKAQVVFVHFAGRSPQKVEGAIMAHMPDGNLFRIAFPLYRSRGYSIGGSRIKVDGEPALSLDVAEPVGAIAIQNLKDHKDRITSKAVARAITKYAANRALQASVRGRDSGTRVLAYIAGNVAAVASEQADLRAWQTLPDRILIGALLLEPGKHKLSAEFSHRSGGTVFTRELGEFELKAGQTEFVILHTNS